MKWEEIYEKTKYAFQNDEMMDLLTGREYYYLPVYGASVPVPTDWTSVISEGIFKLYKEEQNARLIEDYEKTISTLINGNSLEIWMAANIIVYHLQCEADNKASFKVNKDLVSALSKAVNDNKDALAEDKSFQGNGNKYGLLDDILRLNRILHEDCNIDIINA